VGDAGGVLFANDEFRSVLVAAMSALTWPVGTIDPTIPPTLTPNLSAMERIRSSAMQVGLAMGLIFAIVGLVNGNYGLVGLGVVIALAGHFSREADDVS
jgi:hypothetical protein